MAWETEDNEAREYNGKIVDAAFTHHEAFGDVLLLSLDVHTDAGYDRNELLTCGAGWESPDGGKTAKHPTRMSFSSQSNLGKIIDAIAAIPGAVDQINGDPTEASSWVGQEYYWSEQKYSYKTREGELKEKNRMVPVALSGEPVAAAEAAEFKPTGKVLAALRKAARAAEDHDTFVDAAYTVADVEGDLEAWIISEDNYKSLLADD